MNYNLSKIPDLSSSFTDTLTLFTIGGGPYGPPPDKLPNNSKLVRAEGPGFGHF